MRMKCEYIKIIETMRYRDLFIDFDDTLYDTHGNSMIALKKLFDERHWESTLRPTLTCGQNMPTAR